MKRMLINATQQEELRVAMVDGQKLYDLDIESPGRQQKKSNIYKGKVTRVEPSLEAAFVDYGSERHGFLPLKEIARSYFSDNSTSPGRISIKEAVQEGQEVVVQIEKEERGNKGAALTTFISLPGRYLVLMPNNPRAGGVSRRIEGQDRTELREAMSCLEIPEGMGVIVRTAGVGKSAEELQWDLDYLLKLWGAIETSAAERESPFLIFQESNVIIRAIRDYLRADIGEILIDSESVYQEARDFMQHVMPHNMRKVKLYQEDIPLFNRFQIESQIESAFQREVRLPSGGSIVIDHTEALTSVDINSARATKGSDIEETALNTNLEAAEEIARQLRIRDLGGLIVIDFIDMTPARNQREVEQRLKESVKTDRARVQIGRISRFGLLEMSRQRLRPSLGESSHLVCPRCDGHGTIRGVESLALSVLRLVEEEAMKDNTAKVIAQLPVEVATFLLNEKRQIIADIEQRQKIGIVLVPNRHLETPKFEVERVRLSDEKAEGSPEVSSYELENAATTEETETQNNTQPKMLEEPAVKGVRPNEPVPRPPADDDAESPGLLKRIWSSLFGSGTANAANDAEKEPEAEQPKPQRRNERDRDRNRQNNRKHRNERNKDSDGKSENKRQNRRKSSRDDNAQDNNASQQERNRDNKAETAENGENESGRSGTRRGRRGGRNRRRKENTANENAELKNGNEANNSAEGNTAATEKTPEPGNDAENNDQEKEGRRRRNRRRRNRNSDNAENQGGNTSAETGEQNQKASNDQPAQSKPAATDAPAESKRAEKPAEPKPEKSAERPAPKPAAAESKAAAPKPVEKAEASAAPQEKAAPAPKPAEPAAERPAAPAKALAEKAAPPKEAEKPVKAEAPAQPKAQTAPSTPAADKTPAAADKPPKESKPQAPANTAPKPDTVKAEAPKPPAQPKAEAPIKEAKINEAPAKAAEKPAQPKPAVAPAKPATEKTEAPKESKPAAVKETAKEAPKAQPEAPAKPKAEAPAAAAKETPPAPPADKAATKPTTESNSGE